MKYSYLGQRIPKEARKELNEKIIHLVTSNQAEAAGITREDIYNAYTGDGGLHGLHMADFDNYAEFSKAEKRNRKRTGIFAAQLMSVFNGLPGY